MPALRDERLLRQGPLVVWQWRYDQARALGLTIEQAATFADGRGDLGLLRALVDRGCPPRLALRIL